MNAPQHMATQSCTNGVHRGTVTVTWRTHMRLRALHVLNCVQMRMDQGNERHNEAAAVQPFRQLSSTPNAAHIHMNTARHDRPLHVPQPHPVSLSSLLAAVATTSSAAAVCAGAALAGVSASSHNRALRSHCAASAHWRPWHGPELPVLPRQQPQHSKSSASSGQNVSLPAASSPTCSSPCRHGIDRHVCKDYVFASIALTDICFPPCFQRK